MQNHVFDDEPVLGRTNGPHVINVHGRQLVQDLPPCRAPSRNLLSRQLHSPPMMLECSRREVQGERYRAHFQL